MWQSLILRKNTTIIYGLLAMYRCKKIRKICLQTFFFFARTISRFFFFFFFFFSPIPLGCFFFFFSLFRKKKKKNDLNLSLCFFLLKNAFASYFSFSFPFLLVFFSIFYYYYDVFFFFFFFRSRNVGLFHLYFQIGFYCEYALKL
eukprot:TRINITY_DN8395_c0_g1_i2.p1 TRINITY_DN8395_c0_g1~~TRINITY_DN8395_c0_g1_i2.p1  ORF type:complete len:145 (-),score=86.27 TRINITY_DN8395_c0_g1_i2:296-730(-)